MYLDFLFFLLIIFACIKGYRKGLIVSVFSFVAFIIGLAAAVKLSATIATYFDPSNKWTPFISFLLVFIAVSWIVNTMGKALRKGANFMMVGWLDRIGGVIFHCLTICAIASILFFYANQIKLIPDEMEKKSLIIPHLKQFGPQIIDGIGKIIPFFKDMFNQLKNYFSEVSLKITA